MSLSVDIEKGLGDFRLRVAFEHEQGVFGLLGASGCGKSMTLKCIAGIEKPDRGRIVLDGETLFDSEKGIDLPPQKRRVGYLFQHYALFPTMTVRQNIRCGMRGVSRAEQDARLAEAVALFRLEGLLEHRPWQLSGGQAQRVALARILVNRPRLLMLDEPFSALDADLRTRLQGEFAEVLARFGQETLLVTHDRDEAYRLCERMAVMDAGRIVTVGDRRAVFADPGTAAAAAITGCKNIVPAKKTGPHTLRVDVWALDLTTVEPVPDDLSAVGLRAHFMTAAEAAGPNTLPLLDPQVSETPFSVTVMFRAGEGRVRWEIDRTAWAPFAAQGLPPYLRIDLKGVMLLTER